MPEGCRCRDSSGWWVRRATTRSAHRDGQYPPHRLCGRIWRCAFGIRRAGRSAPVILQRDSPGTDLDGRTALGPPADYNREHRTDDRAVGVPRGERAMRIRRDHNRSASAHVAQADQHDRDPARGGSRQRTRSCRTTAGDSGPPLAIDEFGGTGRDLTKETPVDMTGHTRPGSGSDAGRCRVLSAPAAVVRRVVRIDSPHGVTGSTDRAESRHK